MSSRRTDAESWHLGIPTLPFPLVDCSRVADALNAGLERGVPAFVHAPRGFGKTVAVAAWISQRSDLDAVWIRFPPELTEWSDVVDHVAQTLEESGHVAPPTSGVTGWERLVAALRGRSAPLVVVIDGLDHLVRDMLLDEVGLFVETLPAVRLVVLSRELHPQLLSAPARVAVVDATTLAWNEEDVAVLADATVSAFALERIVACSGGRAEAVVHAVSEFAKAGQDPIEPPEQRIEQIVLGWHLDLAVEVGGTDAPAFIAVIADLIELPRPAIIEVAEGFGSVDAIAIDALVSSGLLEWRASAFSGESVLATPADLSESLSIVARGQYDEARRAAHRVLVRQREYAARAPSIHAYHRACGGDLDAAVDLIRQAAFGAGTVDPFILGALMREVPTARLAGDPGLLAARVSFDLSFGTEATVRDASRLLMEVPGSTISGLDPVRRLLIDGSRAHTLILRGDAIDAIRQVSQTAEIWFPRRFELERPARRALAYAVTAGAEANLGLLRLDRAFDLATRALSLPSADRWPITTYRASAVVAMCEAFAGDPNAMDAARRQAMLAWTIAGAPRSLAPVTLAVAEVRDAWGRLDADALSALVPRFEAFERRGATVRGAAAVVEAGAVFAAGDAVRARLLCERLLADSARFTPSFFRAFALLVGALASLSARRPGRVLGLLDSVTSPPGHAICFDSVRAAALLSLGRPSEALAATESCIDPETVHSVGTLPVALSVRAAAHLELRHTAAARADFIEAVRLSPPRWLHGLMALSDPSVLARLKALAPEVAELLGGARVGDTNRPDNAAIVSREALSDVEVALLELLADDVTLGEIAQRRFVSLNTVKSQLRSLYRKLGVASRHEAVDFAHASRFMFRRRTAD